MATVAALAGAGCAIGSSGAQGALPDAVATASPPGGASGSLPDVLASAAPPGGSSSSPPSTFVALDDRDSVPTNNVALYDAVSGDVREDLVKGAPGGMSVVSLALGPGGALWVTYSGGPKFGSDVAGGDPQAGSCASEIVRVDLSTGATSTVLVAGDNELIGGAWPSPDGRYYVYTDSSCVGFYFDQHLTVVDIASGQSWTIGAGLASCHSFSPPSWTPSGDSLVLAYGAASGAGGAFPGSCPQWNAADLVVVNAVQPQPGLSGASVAPAVGCEFGAATSVSTGAVGVEDCQGPQDGPSGTYVDGPVHLIRFDAELRQVQSTSLGQCNDGAELATDPGSSAVLVSGYFYCNPPGPPASNPVARVWAYTTEGLRPVTEVPGNGAGVRDITW